MKPETQEKVGWRVGLLVGSDVGLEVGSSVGALVGELVGVIFGASTRLSSTQAISASPGVSCASARSTKRPAWREVWNVREKPVLARRAHCIIC